MERLPPLRLLVTFDMVCRMGSMQEAAARLNVTPPAVTQAIKALEQEVGVPLLDRSAKPAAPTEAGERLFHATRSGLGLIEETIDDIRFAAGLSELHISLSCTIGMATHWLMPRLPKFYAAFPDITVNVQAPSNDLPLLSPGIDVALRYGRGNWRDGETTLLFAERACPVATPQVLRSVIERGDGLSNAWLIDVRPRTGRDWSRWSDYLAVKGLARASRTPQVFDNYVQAVQATLDGRGIMLGWRSITDTLVAQEYLAEWPEGGHDFGTAYHVTCARNSAHKRPVRQFRDWLVAEAHDWVSATSSR